MDYKNKSFISKRKAFTLIELLIVIAIIGILFIVLVSKVDFATDKAKATGVQTDFRSFQVAFDTVAKENAGFNTFGWDTGDTNGDRVRNSYDVGDTNKDGKMDTGETWTGRKQYTENWTGVYTLVKPGTSDLDADAIFKLESAINKNLDPKLHITISTDGVITMANQAQDPWKTEYHGVYLSNAANDGKDRGAFIMYSNGANQEFGSEHSIANGIVTITVPGNNKLGADDYSIVSVYTYANGYGEVKNVTTGFSNNQTMLGGNNIGGNAMTPVEPYYPTASEGLSFNLKGDGTYELSGIGECTDTDIVIPAEVDGKAVTSIAYAAFGDKGSLITSVVIPGSVKEIDGCAFVCCDYLESVMMYNGVVTIQYSAFAQCPALTSVTIPDSVMYIGDDAFSGTNINSIVIPAGVTRIGINAFMACDNLSSIIVKSGNENYHSKNNCLIETASKTLLTGCKNSIIPTDGSVAIIGGSAFSGCSGLTSITIPNSVTSIGNDAFAGCSSLTSITMQDSVTSIGMYAFSGCSSLTRVTISNNVTSISGYAFLDCDSLTSITIPVGVTRIGESAFQDCGSLKNVTFDGTVAQWNNVELGFYWDHGAPITHITCNDENVEMYPVFGIFSSATTANVNIPFDYKTYDEDDNLIDATGSVWGIGNGYDMSHYYDVAVGTEIIVHTNRTCKLYYYKNINGQNTKIYLDDNVRVDTENQVTYITLPDVGSDVVIEVE